MAVFAVDPFEAEEPDQSCLDVLDDEAGDLVVYLGDVDYFEVLVKVKYLILVLTIAMLLDQITSKLFLHRILDLNIDERVLLRNYHVPIHIVNLLVRRPPDDPLAHLRAQHALAQSAPVVTLADLDAE